MELVGDRVLKGLRHFYDGPFPLDPPPPPPSYGGRYRMVAATAFCLCYGYGCVGGTAVTTAAAELPGLAQPWTLMEVPGSLTKGNTQRNYHMMVPPLSPHPSHHQRHGYDRNLIRLGLHLVITSTF